MDEALATQSFRVSEISKSGSVPELKVHNNLSQPVLLLDGEALVGFVNVAWDGGVHAFILDTLTAATQARRGIGTELVGVATDNARTARCEWLHVDFDDDLREFYFNACGFRPRRPG